MAYDRRRAFSSQAANPSRVVDVFTLAIGNCSFDIGPVEETASALHAYGAKPRVRPLGDNAAQSEGPGRPSGRSRAGTNPKLPVIE